MLIAIGIALSFGLIAGFSFLVLWRSGMEASAKWPEIRAELKPMDHRLGKIPQAVRWRLLR